MEVISELTLDKGVIFSDKAILTKQTRRTINKGIDEEY